MSRNLITKPKMIVIHNIGEAQTCMKELAIDKQLKAKRTADYNAKELERRGKYFDGFADTSERKEQLEQALRVYSEENRVELFGDRQSLSLIHGTLSFRVSTPKVEAVAVKGCTQKTALTKLCADSDTKERFVKTEEKINKDAIREAYRTEEISTENLAKYDLRVTQVETFAADPELAIEEAVA